MGTPPYENNRFQRTEDVPRDEAERNKQQVTSDEAQVQRKQDEIRDSVPDADTGKQD